MIYTIEVGYKDALNDASGMSTKKDIEDLGIYSVRQVRASQLYIIEGEIEEDKILSVCRELLSDPVIQYFKINESSGKGSLKADVYYKKGVTDAVGESVKIGIRDMGIDGVESVRTGARYEITGRLSGRIVRSICERLLANKVVQEYKII